MAVKKGDKRGHYKRRVREKKYVCSCSFGKDSLATLLLALEHGEPLDCVIYVEVMYDISRGISGENPLHVRWVYDVAIPKLREMGVDVVVLRTFCRLRRDYNDLWHDLYAYKDADNLVSDRFKYDLSLVDLCKRMDDYEEKYQEYL